MTLLVCFRLQVFHRGNTCHHTMLLTFWFLRTTMQFCSFWGFSSGNLSCARPLSAETPKYFSLLAFMQEHVQVNCHELHSANLRPQSQTKSLEQLLLSTLLAMNVHERQLFQVHGEGALVPEKSRGATTVGRNRFRTSQNSSEPKVFRGLSQSKQGFLAWREQIGNKRKTTVGKLSECAVLTQVIGWKELAALSVELSSWNSAKKRNKRNQNEKQIWHVT